MNGGKEDTKYKTLNTVRKGDIYREIATVYWYFVVVVVPFNLLDTLQFNWCFRSHNPWLWSRLINFVPRTENKAILMDACLVINRRSKQNMLGLHLFPQLEFCEWNTINPPNKQQHKHTSHWLRWICRRFSVFVTRSMHAIQCNEICQCEYVVTWKILYRSEYISLCNVFHAMCVCVCVLDDV